MPPKMCERELVACGMEEQTLQAAAMAVEASCGHLFTMDVLMHRSSAPTPRPLLPAAACCGGADHQDLVHLGG